MKKRAGHRGVTSTLTTVRERPMVTEDREPTAKAEPTKLLLTPQEAADVLSINRSTLYELILRDEIPSIKIGRARRIPVKWLEEWIEAQLAA